MQNNPLAKVTVDMHVLHRKVAKELEKEIEAAMAREVKKH